jgi:hypothetical protein
MLYESTVETAELDVMPFEVEITEGTLPEMLFWKNGNYRITDNKGTMTTMDISGISKPSELSGAWDVRFPAGLGAPEQIRLPELISLHRHELAGVRYFSGTATYNKKFRLEGNLFGEGKHLFLDLGRVEIAAEVYLNGKNLGVLWGRPYQVEITDEAKEGENDLSVRVVNLWPNRLIGDEQLPPEYEFDQPQADRGACIKKMPDWYLNGQPKPKGKRIAFSTWKHYRKDDPLLESGLIGPVVIKNAIKQKI